MTEPVTWEWGDGAVEEGGRTATHTYKRRGRYRLHVFGDGLNVFAWIPVAGPGDAQPTLTIPDVEAEVGETVTYDTEIDVEDGTTAHCRGRVVISPTSGRIAARALSIVQKEFNPGEDLSITFRGDGAGGVVGEYGGRDGFPLFAGLAGHTTNELTYTGEPFTADCHTEIRDEHGAVLCKADWTLTVTDGKG